MTRGNGYNITLIGCGTMGGAMIQGWLNANLIKHAEILDPNDLDDSLTSHPDLFHVKLMESISLDLSNIIILAVKPQIMDSVCQQLADKLPKDLPVLSIAAGKTTGYFERHFGGDAPIVRAMPNTPAAIGKGISALYATPSVTTGQKKIANDLMAATGSVLWLEDESQMDAVTALSGSGPAYVFYLIEAMAKAGETMGLSLSQAMQLARQTVIGSSALAEHETELSAATLRQNVTSPKGTTEAALSVLMDERFQEILNEALLAAQRRAQELAD